MRMEYREERRERERGKEKSKWERANKNKQIKEEDKNGKTNRKIRTGTIGIWEQEIREWRLGTYI